MEFAGPNCGREPRALGRGADLDRWMSYRMNLECECRQKEWDARILLPGGEEITKGWLKLPGGPGEEGYFWPSQPTSPSQRLDIQPHAEVVAVVSSHRHRLCKWRFCQLQGHGPSILARPLGMIIKGHFHFDEAV